MAPFFVFIKYLSPQGNTYMSRYLFLLFFLSFSACSSIEPASDKSKRNSDDKGSFITGKSEQGFTIDDITGRSNQQKTTGIPVNALLWRAALNIASILPVGDIDVFSGTLLTDWYSLPSKPSERIKIAIFVLDKELRSDAIRVVVYVQSRQENIWKDAGIDTELAKKLEELILTRAREIRSSSVAQ